MLLTTVYGWNKLESIITHKTNIFRSHSLLDGHSLGKSCTWLIKRMNCNELVSCLSCSSAGSKSEPILLSKFCLIMHSSLLPRPLQPCLYPPLILPSVRQQPAGHTLLSLLAVPHRVPTPFVCVSLSYCQSFPLPSHLSLFMFSNSTDKMGREQCCLTLWCVRSPHRSVSVRESASQPTCYLMGISICCQITFSARPSHFFPLKDASFS